MSAAIKRFFVIFMALILVGVMIPHVSADYKPPYSRIKVGLYAGSERAFASANLQNASGYGYGYELGYYDESRNFVSVGAVIKDTNKTTMIMDKNMVYDASKRLYNEGTEGDVAVGCFHLREDVAYSTWEEAEAAALELAQYGNSFVKYSGGTYYALWGSYMASADALAEAETLELPFEPVVDSGTGYTVTVVETGTARILFEFDYGTTYYLAVHPLSDGAEDVRTYYKNTAYRGDFIYVRAFRDKMTVVNCVEIEDYVKGLLPSEMSASWPLEALKAQAVCARTYAMRNLNKHKSQGFDICNTTDCQVYEGTNKASANSDKAAEETAGMYLTYEGALCETYYYSCNGGASENSENVWAYPHPYLTGVLDPYEAAVADRISNYNWTVTFTGETMAARLRSRGYSCGNIVKFEITEFTPTGNVLRIRITDENGKVMNFSKENCRLVLGLRSMRYTISGGEPTDGTLYINDSSHYVTGPFSELFGVGAGGVDALGDELYAITGKGIIEKLNPTSTGTEDDTFVIKGSGWGHNVGMSQWGAYSMAKYYDKTYDEILSFYYQQSEITLVTEN